MSADEKIQARIDEIRELNEKHRASLPELERREREASAEAKRFYDRMIKLEAKHKGNTEMAMTSDPELADAYRAATRAEQIASSALLGTLSAISANESRLVDLQNPDGRERRKITQTEKRIARLRGRSNMPKTKTPQKCECGCGGMTKGGSYIAGHDARHKSALVSDAMNGNEAAATEAKAILKKKGWTKFLTRKIQIVKENAAKAEKKEKAAAAKKEKAAKAKADAQKKPAAKKKTTRTPSKGKASAAKADKTQPGEAQAAKDAGEAIPNPKPGEPVAA